MAKIADKIYDLIKDAVEGCGVRLWNVVFVKEGSSHYLRIFIDSDEGISIDDCMNVSHAVDPIIDDADPIDCSYYLEVCSPGIERELVRDEHFKLMMGKEISLRLFKATDGMKEITGKLVGFDGNITVLTGKGELTFERSQISKVNLKDY